jgi:hypothetical protein
MTCPHIDWDKATEVPAANAFSRFGQRAGNSSGLLRRHTASGQHRFLYLVIVIAGKVRVFFVPHDTSQIRGAVA